MKIQFSGELILAIFMGAIVLSLSILIVVRNSEIQSGERFCESHGAVQWVKDDPSRGTVLCQFAAPPGQITESGFYVVWLNDTGVSP